MNNATELAKTADLADALDGLADEIQERRLRRRTRWWGSMTELRLARLARQKQQGKSV